MPIWRWKDLGRIKSKRERKYKSCDLEIVDAKFSSIF
jgi:hypothetical protein